MNHSNAQLKLDQQHARVHVNNGKIDVIMSGETLQLPSIALPKKFSDWIDRGRRSMYDFLLGNSGKSPFFASHLPVMVTRSSNDIFPGNCSNKGVGYIPKEEYLEESIELFQKTLTDSRKDTWEKSLKKRLDAVSSFYFNPEKINYNALSSLEIFEKRTFNNIKQRPMAGLLFTGNGPDYISFQLNCVVEIVRPGDPRFEFVKLARVMFEYDSFHIAQPGFACAYIFWISDVIDKSPYRVDEKEDKVIRVEKFGNVEWTSDAIDAVNRAPGMVQQFIREKIEQYAVKKGVNRVTLELVTEAKERMEKNRAQGHSTKPNIEAEPGKPEAEKELVKEPEKEPVTAKASGCPFHQKTLRKISGNNSSQKPAEETAKVKVPGKYNHVYVGLDSSRLSNEAMEYALEFGRKDGAKLCGSHAYAAKLHDQRFKTMEGGLPEQFQQEQELERQRRIHDSLITKGLELITDSYLVQMENRCKQENIPFSGASLEGRNWKVLYDDVMQHDYDLVALGAHGVGKVKTTQLGTVAERLIRALRRDVLLVRQPLEENQSNEIVVCLDGSTRGWGGLYRGMHLARQFGKKLIAISAFDPYFHYVMFSSLNKSLTTEARKVFKFEEQEKLHEEIIDSGLAKIYQSHLNLAKRVCDENDMEVEIKLLDGKPYDTIIKYLNEKKPWLAILGRIGIHSDESMDIGGNTENICRQAECNVLVVDSSARPSDQLEAEETVTWTKEAEAAISKAPSFAQGVARQSVQSYCVARGYTVVTEGLLQEALADILPPAAQEKMGIKKKEKSPDQQTSEDGQHDRIALIFRCESCGHVQKGLRPKTCIICGNEGSRFKIVESRRVEEGQNQQSMDGRTLLWEQKAIELLDTVSDQDLKQRIRSQAEKKALTMGKDSITEEDIKEVM